MSNTSLIRTRGALCRRFPFLVLSAALFATGVYPVSTSAEEEALPKGEKILDMHLEAMGGREAYKKLRNRVTKGTFSIPGMTAKAKLTTYAAAPLKTYTLIESDMIGKIESGTDGETVWEITTMMGPQIKKGDERAFGLREAMFHGILDWKKVYKSAECVAVEEIDATPCYKVVMTPNEGKPETLYYDKKTNLLVKMEFELQTAMGTMSVVATPSDYKRVDGILIAHKIVQEVIDLQKIEIVFESVEHNTKIAPDRFKLPAAVQELVDKKSKEAASERTSTAAKKVPVDRD